MRYAAIYKSDSEALAQFIRRKGGINACAARFTRYAGRIKPTSRGSAHPIITPHFERVASGPKLKVGRR